MKKLLLPFFLLFVATPVFAKLNYDQVTCDVVGRVAGVIQASSIPFQAISDTEILVFEVPMIDEE